MTRNRQGWIECSPEVLAGACEGDAAAVERLLRSLQDPVYALALRMLADSEAARDATQEVLLRVSRSIGGFRGESSMSTWAYRIAVNVLLTATRSASERRTTSFELVEEQLDRALAASERLDPIDDPVLIEETKLFCTHGMLLCLDRGHRAAYILGEIFEVASSTVAAALEISEEALRKRLSRARVAMNEFMRARCGLVNEAVRCRCEKLTAVAIAQELISPDRIQYALHPTAGERALRGEMQAYASALDLFRDHPHYLAVDLVTALRSVAKDDPTGS